MKLTPSAGQRNLRPATRRVQLTAILSLFILVCLVTGVALAGSSSPTPVAPQPSGPLYALFLEDGFSPQMASSAGLALYGRQSSARGEYLLVGGTTGTTARQGLTLRLLDDNIAGAYYLAYPPANGRPVAWGEYGSVLLDLGDQVLLRTDPVQAEMLPALGAEIVRLNLEPQPWDAAKVSPTPLPPLPAYPADPQVQAMLDQVSTATITTYTSQLSGLQPVTVGGQPYTITSRYTYSGTPIQKAGQFVGEHMQALGMAVNYHVWGSNGTPATYPNVIGQITGSTNPGDIYIIGAHLDDMPSSGAAPGADDNGSGSVGTLIAADILSQYQWSCTLRFAFWTGEEQGLLGSAAYATQLYNQSQNVKGYLNMDMIAYNGSAPNEINLFAKSTVPGSVAMMDLYADTVSAYGLNLVPVKYTDNSLGDRSDNKSFWNRGYASMLAIEDYYGDFTPYYHTANDTLSTLNMAYYTDFVKASLATFVHLTGCLITGPLPTDTPTPTATDTPTATATDTPTPTATDTPTNTPTNSPTPTYTNTPAPAARLYLGSSTSGTAGGVAFADEDILIKDMGTGDWSLFIDGSDIGLGGSDVDAFEWQTDGTLLMSFDTAFTLSGFGAVDDSDILRFTPTSTGSTTAGTWAWYFDGSDVGLTTNDEDVDAFAILSDGRLLVSTLGSASVTDAAGEDEDLLAFTPTSLGSTTTGSWLLYFDGSDVGLTTNSEDVNGAWLDAAGKIYLTTLGNFSVTGLSGDAADIFACVPGTTGANTTCTWSMYWDASANGFAGEDTDSLGILP